MDQHVAPADVDLVGEAQRDAHGRVSALDLPLEGIDGRDARHLARGQHHDRIPTPHASGVPGRIDVQQREGRAAVVEGLAREMDHHARVLADRVEHHGTLELGDDLPHDMNALRLQSTQMTEAQVHNRFDVHSCERHDEVIVSTGRVRVVKRIVREKEDSSVPVTVIQRAFEVSRI
jgi:hypothetical protein